MCGLVHSTEVSWQGICGPIDYRPYVQKLLGMAAITLDPTLARRLRYRAWLLETGRDEDSSSIDCADFLIWDMAKLLGPR